MKKDLTELVFILDASGSMCNLEEDTIGGFNSMIDKQRTETGEALVSTVIFNNTSTVVHDRVPVEKVPPMTRKEYTTMGCTALLDAVGDAIRHIGNVHKYAREEDVPEHTLFIITTDGMENASHRYTADEVKRLITRQKEKYGWEFLFLGANIDAVETAAHIGIQADRAANYRSNPTGTEACYRMMSQTVSNVRNNAAIEPDWKDELEATVATERERREKPQGLLGILRRQMKNNG